LQDWREHYPSTAGSHHLSCHLFFFLYYCTTDLSRAADQESTLTALSIVCVEFDHNDTIKHNAELYYGATGVLAEKLSIMDHTCDHEAIRMVCAAIEMVFRGGSKYVKEAFRVYAPIMMPPLLRLMDKCEQSKVKHADEIILNITKTFHYVSKIPEVRVSLARQTGLLDWLERVASTPLNVPSRNIRVRIMANLANCEDNKVLMYAHKGLLTSMLKIAQFDLVDVTREYATSALMDLASAPANQVPLARNGHVLRVLTTMVVNEKISMIRESTTTTLQNLAFPKSNRKRLVHFEEGIVIEALLYVVSKDSNEKARRRAAGALTNLAYDGTAEAMAGRPGLLKTLANVAIAGGNQTVQSRACLALTKIASNIRKSSRNYKDVIDALVIAADTTVENNISAVFRLRAREPECRESMARHEGVLEKLSDMCTRPNSSLKDRDNATRALMHLANATTNHKIMCNDKVLAALVQGTVLGSPPVDGDDELGRSPLDSPPHAAPISTLDVSGDDQHFLTEIQDSAIRAIARLATEVSNRQVMAKHKGLITAIAKATERESKLQVQGVESDKNQQQNFLGKPLLLSLLVAL